jgi:thiamine biosynthesis lipoprotein
MIEPLASTAKPAPEFPLRRFGREAMACTFEVLLVEEDAKYAEQAALAALAEVDRLEQELSRFVPHSDVARINALQPGQTVQVGIETLECLRLAGRVYEETGGAFDITFRSRGVVGAPHAAAPLELDPKSRSIGVGADRMQIDLGGVGKGYAIDQIVAILRDWSISAALVHCGQSTVFALGSPPGATGWSVAIRDPVKHDESLGAVQLSDAALSGSGRKLHGDHIIDPRSGQPVEDRLGAWALAPSAALSDALATAFMIMAPNEVGEYCQRRARVSGLVCAETAGGPVLSRYGKSGVFAEWPRGE